MEEDYDDVDNKDDDAENGKEPAFAAIGDSAEGIFESLQSIIDTSASKTDSSDYEIEIDFDEKDGDVVPRWLITDEEEEENGNSFLDEISMKVDHGTEAECTSSTPVADTCQS